MGLKASHAEEYIITGTPRSSITGSPVPGPQSRVQVPCLVLPLKINASQVNCHKLAMKFMHACLSTRGWPHPLT